jgi:hypothetical protein
MTMTNCAKIRSARRQDCEPVAGKSTLNRLELSRPEPTRYHKISHDPAAIESLFVSLFVEAHKRPPREIVLDLDATDDPVHGEREGRFFRGSYDHYCYRPLYVFCGRRLLAAKLRPGSADAALRCGRGDGADRCANPLPLAEGAHPVAWR